MEQSIKKKAKVYSRTRNRLIFYTIMLIWPVLQMAIFYVYVNFNSILLAFQKYTENTNGIGYIITFDKHFENFQVAWSKLIIDKLWMIGNSLKFYAIDYPTSIILCMSFSFYIYKKYPGSGVFKVFLYLPQIISGLVLSIIFKYLADYGYREIVSLIHYGGDVIMDSKHISQMVADGVYNDGGLLYNENTALITVIIFNISFSFGSGMLLYSSTMSSIDESVVESCQLDGCNVFQEFWFITLPLIFPTFKQLFITSLCGIFTNQMSILSLYGENCPPDIRLKICTLGYDIYLKTSVIGQLQNQQYVSFSAGELAAWGVILSVIMVPLIMWLRKVLTKFGPSVD